MIKKGKGLALAMHTTGAKGNGDPDQAHIRLKTDGTFDLSIITEEMGQGARTVFLQIASEALGVPENKITVINFSTDSGPNGSTTGGSRSTFISGNAIILAAEDLKRKIIEVAAACLNTAEQDLLINEGYVHKKDDSSISMDFAAIGASAAFNTKDYLMGCGNYMLMPYQPMDTETGQCDAVAAIAYVAGVAEVEVDTDTGVVDVKKLYSAYEVGRAINPLLIEGQIHGGDSMALGTAIMENVAPAYPDLAFQPRSFADYIIPTAADMPEYSISILENPDPVGPFGAKGCGELTVDWQPAAIINAIHDATGVWIDSTPVTPEKILRALDQKG